MENASKALVMAGAIIIALVIVSLSFFVFKQWSDKSMKMADMTEQEIEAFNSKITPYLGQNVSGSQVNALLTYCLSVNMAAKKNGEEYKAITVSGATTLNIDSTSISRVATGSSVTYSVIEQYKDGLINTLEITRNP